MLPPVIATGCFPAPPITAITLFGIVFTRRRELVTPRVMRHERIHCRQQMEWLYIPFFILYVGEWLYYLLRLRDGDAAYRAISFEREAYSHDADPHYLSSRPLFANYRRSRT